MTKQSPNKKDLEQLKVNYAQLIVDGMDMDSLITFAVESVEKNLEDWNWDEVTEEIVQHYGEDTLIDLLPDKQPELTEIGKLEATAPDYGVGK